MSNFVTRIYGVSQVYRWFYHDVMIIAFPVFLLFYLLAKSVAFAPNPFFFILGITFLVFIPGYYLAKIIGQKVDIDVVGYSFIFGLTIQIINIGFYYVLSVFVCMSFDAFLILTTIISVTALKFILSIKTKVLLDLVHVRMDFSKSLSSPIMYVFLFSLLIRLYYCSFNTTSILPDASLYLDTARTLVSKGIFASNVINDESFLLNPYLATNGLIEHVFTTFIFALFFLISDVSLNSALLATAFIGSLLVYPIHDLTRTFFERKAAFIAALLVSVHPLFIYFSSILYGPEIMGLLFLLASLYIILEGVRRKSPLVLFIAGTLMGIAAEIWWAYLYLVAPLLPLILVLYNERPVDNSRRKIAGFIMCAFFVFLYLFALKLYSLVFIWAPVVIIEFVALVLVRKSKYESALYALNLVAGLMVPSILKIMRHYIVPLQVRLIMERAIDRGLVPSILSVFTLFSKSSPVNEVVDYIKYLSYHAPAVLLMLFALSFLIGRKWRDRFILGGLFVIHLTFVSIWPLPSYPQYLYSRGRYYLLPTALIVIGGSHFLSNTIKTALADRSSITLRFRRKTKTIKPQFIAAITLLFILFGAFFVPQYLDRIEAISIKENPLMKYGWSIEMLEWIKNNPPDHDVFLSARPRELAWFTNRKTVNIMYPFLQLRDIGHDELIKLATQFNATYVVVDSYFFSNFPKLRNLHRLMSSPIGTCVLPEDAIVSFLTNATLVTQAYQLVFSHHSEKAMAGVWKILAPSDFEFELVYREDFFGEDWSVGNKGKLVTENVTSKLVIGEGKQYTYTYLKTPLNRRLEADATKFFAWKVTEIDNAEIRRIEIWSNNGKHLTDATPPSTPCIWVTYFDVMEIGDIRVVIAGNPGGYLTMEWVTIGTFQLTIKT